MKIIAIIPIKSNSKRVPKKNFKMINGKPLYRYLLDNLSKCNFDEIYVDSNSKQIEKFFLKKNYSYIKRLPKLAKDNANGNHLLNYHAKLINADYYFQLFVTAPLLKIKSINKCIKILKLTKILTSILTVKKLTLGFGLKPINYKPQKLPRSQDALPVIQETTGLYGIKRNALIKNKCRIEKPYFLKFPNKKL